jgi:hypothetical protein
MPKNKLKLICAFSLVLIIVLYTALFYAGRLRRHIPHLTENIGRSKVSSSFSRLTM